MLTLHCEKTTGKTLYVHIRHLEFIGTFICFGAHDIVFVHYPIGFHINCFVKMSKYIEIRGVCCIVLYCIYVQTNLSSTVWIVTSEIYCLSDT